ncbi:MAG: transcriptional regulator [Caldiserica bacterium]|nr:MAG: transcriptional regulator [Caldisericota bacterium]
MENLFKTVGNYIRKYRKERKMTQEELAEKCNLHPTYIAKLETGRQGCSLKTLSKIALALNVPPQALLGPVTKKQLILYNPQREKLSMLLNKMNEKERNILFIVAESFLKAKKRLK